MFSYKKICDYCGMEDESSEKMNCENKNDPDQKRPGNLDGNGRIIDEKSCQERGFDFGYKKGYYQIEKKEVPVYADQISPSMKNESSGDIQDTGSKGYDITGSKGYLQGSKEYLQDIGSKGNMIKTNKGHRMSKPDDNMNILQESGNCSQDGFQMHDNNMQSNMHGYYRMPEEEYGYDQMSMYSPVDGRYQEDKRYYYNDPYGYNRSPYDRSNYYSDQYNRNYVQYSNYGPYNAQGYPYDSKYAQYDPKYAPVGNMDLMARGNDPMSRNSDLIVRGCDQYSQGWMQMSRPGHDMSRPGHAEQMNKPIKMKPEKEPKQRNKNRVCSNCETKTTPSWRRGLNGKNLLCNACGLYQKLHGRARPFSITVEGRTKALKGNYDKVACVACTRMFSPVETKVTENGVICRSCSMYYTQTAQGMDNFTYPGTAPSGNGPYYYPSYYSSTPYPEQSGNLPDYEDKKF